MSRSILGAATLFHYTGNSQYEAHLNSRKIYTTESHSMAFHAVKAEVELFVKPNSRQIVLAGLEFDTSNTFYLRLLETRMQSSLAYFLASVVWQDTHSEASSMGDRVLPSGEDIRPTDNAVAVQCNKLDAVIDDTCFNELLHLFQG